MEALTIPRNHAVGAERGRGDRAAEALHGGAKSLFEIAFAGETCGEVAADDQVVNVRNQVFNAGIYFIEIGDDGNAGRAGPGSGLGCCCSFKSVDMQGPRIHDPGAIEVGGLEQEALIATAENGAFAAVIDEDERLRTGGIGHGDQARIHAGAGKLFAMETGPVVVAELADVARGEAPGLAGDHGGGGLAAGQDAGVGVLSFGAAGREMSERDERIDCVETHAHQVNLSRLCHSSHCKGEELNGAGLTDQEKRVVFHKTHVHPAAEATRMTASTPTQAKFMESAGTRAFIPSQTKTATEAARIA